MVKQTQLQLAASSVASFDADAPARMVRHEVTSGGRTMPVQVFYPTGYPASGDGAALPWLLYLHAGGFVEGNLEKAQRLTSQLAVTVPAVVVVPDYSLAPDHPFPAAPEDAYNTIEWVLRNGRRLKLDKTRFALVGEEAGGNLAIALAQMLRDRGLATPRGQWLIRPVTDPCLQHASCTSGVNGGASLETLQRLAGYYRDYLPTPAASVHPYAAPAHASRLGGMPETLILVAEEDALRPEGEAFAQRLTANGVPAEARIMPGTCGSGVEDPHARCLVWINEGARFLRQRLAGDDDASARSERRPGDQP